VVEAGGIELGQKDQQIRDVFLGTSARYPQSYPPQKNIGATLRFQRLRAGSRRLGPGLPGRGRRGLALSRVGTPRREGRVWLDNPFVRFLALMQEPVAAVMSVMSFSSHPRHGLKGDPKNCYRNQNRAVCY